ncbi:MAG: hypothetical protein AABX38_04155 [Candidatus Micrarchaeota archaeon]
MKLFYFLFLAFIIFAAFGCLGAGSKTSPFTVEKNSFVSNLSTSPAATSIANKTINNTQKNETEKLNELLEKVVPSKRVILNAKWNDLGPKTIKSGSLNLDKFSLVMQRNGYPLDGEQMGILENGSTAFISIDRQNSQFLLNLFWAFGLVNKNNVLDNGTMAEQDYMIPKYASTGGWPLGDASGGALYSSVPIIKLNKKQQQLVEKISSSTYRPCCNNPTSFPDCNHGMAALGLIEWMAYQNASEENIYDALLIANSYWFPQTYYELAVYFDMQNRSWESIDPREILSFNYSSASGSSSIREKVKDVPAVKIYGGNCAV